MSPADSAARAGAMPEASGDSSSGTLAKNMTRIRFLILFVASVFSCVAAEPEPAPSPKIKAFTGGWGKGQGTSSHAPSRLDALTPDQFKKTSDLAHPLKVTILSTGRTVEGIETIKDRIVDVRITNPNPYTIFFRGRQYKDNKTIKPGWNKLENGVWKLAGWDSCGTGVRDWDIEPNGTMDLMLYLHPDLKEQQILGIFFKADEPSIQSEIVLYEKR
jgi:hypothetical protein